MECGGRAYGGKTRPRKSRGVQMWTRLCACSDSTFEDAVAGRVQDRRESRWAGVDHPYGQSGEGDGDPATHPAELRSGKRGRYLVQDERRDVEVDRAAASEVDDRARVPPDVQGRDDDVRISDDAKRHGR